MGNPLPPRESLAKERAGELRGDSTPAERQLWSMVRAKRLAGLKFRRQVPIGPFIADFYCHEQQLVLEVDGVSHDVRVEYDADRTRYLESLKLKVLRLRNEDVLANLEAVGITILQAVGVDPRPWLEGQNRTRLNEGTIPISGQ